MSLSPSTYKTGGGGLYDDVVIAVKAIEYTNESPSENYTAPDGVENPLFARLTLRVEGAEEDIIDNIFLGAAASNAFGPSDDGKDLVPEFEGAQLSDKSKWAVFVGSAIAAGVPDVWSDNKDSYDVASLEGYSFHVKRLPTNSGFKRQGKNGKEYEDTAINVTRVVSAPGEAGKGKKAGAKAGAKAAPVAAKGKVAKAAEPEVEEQDGGDIEVQTVDLLNKLLKENKGKITKGQITLLVTKEATKTGMDSATREAVRKLMFSDAFLEQEGLGFAFDKAKSTISVAK